MSFSTQEEFEAPKDHLFNYTIHEEIGRGGTAVVYRATCERGRLRNRVVALKKIGLSSSAVNEVAHISASTSLHQSLFHPSIVSLLSYFATPTTHYHVMELCSNGTLASLLQSRSPQALTEAELRGVVRSIVDGLLYLRKQLIIHRDIKPSNILIDGRYRVKISDFGLATKLPSEHATASTFCGSPNYVSPEIIARKSYNFSTDVWSLGAVLVTSICGTPAFDAPSLDGIFQNISQAYYALPPSSSYEIQDLVFEMLQPVGVQIPEHRILLDKILAHQFFNPSLRVEPLGKDESFLLAHPLQVPGHRTKPRTRAQLYYPNTMSLDPEHRPPIRKLKLKTLRLSRTDIPPDRVAAHNGRRDVWSDTWKPLRTAIPPLARRLSSAPETRLSFAPSDRFPQGLPVPTRSIQTRPSSQSDVECVGWEARTPALTGDYDSIATLSEGILEEYDQREVIDPPVPCKALDLDAHPLLRLPVRWQDTSVRSADDDRPASPASEQSIIPSTSTRYPLPTRLDNLQAADAPPKHSHPPPISLLPATPKILPHSSEHSGKPSQLNTDRLTPQTHKVSRGQFVILPSKCILVDLREGERRKGRKGHEVLVISADGNCIQVYSAPHLSAPCCLAEPMSVFQLSELPKGYWEQYYGAAKFVNQLKQRIPKIVMYLNEGQCTMMANEPYGDVEILLPPPNVGEANERQVGPSTRVRLRQDRRTIEVASHTFLDASVPPDAKTGEWTTRILPVTQPGYITEILGLRNADLGSQELAGVKLLQDFLKICEAIHQETAKVAGGPSADPKNEGVCVGSSRETNRQTNISRPSGELASGCVSVLARKEMAPPGTDVLATASSVTSTGNYIQEPTCATLGSTIASRTLGRMLVSESRLPSALSKLPPRPPKLSSTRDSTPTSIVDTITGDSAQTAGSHGCVDRTVPRRFTSEDTMFVPSLGWCTRIASSTGQDIHYKVMSSDGSTLEIDVMRGTVHRNSSSGQYNKCSLAEFARGRSSADQKPTDVIEKLIDAFKGLAVKGPSHGELLVDIR